MLSGVRYLMDGDEHPTGGTNRDDLLDLLTSILDTAIDPLVSVDEQGRIVLFNQAASRVFGYRSSEVIGRPLAILLPHRFGAAHVRHLEAFASRGRTTRPMGQVGSVLGRRKCGEEFPAEASISRVETDWGTILTASVRDISSREAEESRYRSLFENAVAGIVQVDRQGRLLDLNPEMARMLGFDSPDQVLAEVEHLSRLVAATDLDDRLRQTLTAAAVREFEVEEDLLRRDGSLVTVLATGRVLRGDRNRPTGVLFVVVDITERRRIETDLRRSEARLLATQALAHVGSIEWDVHTGSAHWSTQVFRILGYDPGALSPSRSAYVRHIVIEDRRRVADAVSTGVDTGGFDIEYEIRTRAGDLRVVRERGEFVEGPDGRPGSVFTAIHDVTDRHRAERVLQHQATHDPLTGLPNRALLLDRIQLALERRARTKELSSVHFLDLDRFKVINDSLGHSAGDALLIEAARRITATVRSGDTVARFGGDEFVVLQEQIAEPRDAELLAARLVEVLSQPYSYSGRSLHLGVSIGIAVADDDSDAESLIRDADTAMYQAKAGGRGQASRFTDMLRERASERLQVEQDLRAGMHEGQLFLEFQPIVDLTTGAWTSLEALVRWNHPRLGHLGPAGFIAVAEETGLISKLGSWVLSEACSVLSDLDGRGYGPLDLAVNVSPVQIAGPDLAATVEAVARGHRIDPSRLCLEVTETALLHDTERTRRVLGKLRSLGTKISLDDFGTGSASLSHLRRFPVTGLKIDRSFVAGLPADGDDASIVRTVLAMGDTMGMTVVAEGVERPDQKAALHEHGCRYAQGFHLSRPLGVDALIATLRERARVMPGPTLPS